MSGRLIGGVATLAVSPRPPSPGMLYRGMARLRGSDLYGDGRISGTVTIAGVPASKKVRCYDVASGQYVAETRSAADGTYSVPNLSVSRRYLLVAHDDAELYNAAVADLVEPVRDL